MFIEGVAIERIIRETGTPVYIYSVSDIEKRITLLKDTLKRIGLYFIAYAVKSNSNLSVLKIIKRMGCGVEVVSGGELFRAFQAGFSPSKIIFTGTGKTEEEIEYAIKSGIFMLVIENEEEAELIRKIAERKRKETRVAVRVNPGIDFETHPYIATSLKESKFGVDEECALRIYRGFKGSRYVRAVGIHMHLGSQIKKVDVYFQGIERLIEVVKSLQAESTSIKYLDVGGGFGISYEDDNEVFDLEKFSNGIEKYLKRYGFKLIIEPGRFITCKSGVLVGRIMYRKRMGDKTFYITDIGMNDLLRPSLYNATHRIMPVVLKEEEVLKCDVVGPVCESGDFIGKEVLLPNMEKGEMIAVMEVGAYGFVMSSNYNSRPRPAEVIVKGKRFKVVRKRDCFQDLIRGEVW